MTKREYKKAKNRQVLIGISLIIISIIAIIVASKGTTIMDKDATLIVITIPMGLYLIFTKEIVIE